MRSSDLRAWCHSVSLGSRRVSGIPSGLLLRIVKARCCMSVEQPTGLSPGDPDPIEDRIRRIVDFWNELDCCGEPGATTWGVLEGLRLEVTECLDGAPPDVNKAESLTAYALLLMTGTDDL